MKIFTPLRFVICACVAITAFSSCRKVGDDEVTKTDTASNNSQLLINLPKTSISIDLVDSVNATFFDGGSQTYNKRGSRGGSFYLIPLTSMHNGNWQATVKMYTKASGDTPSRMYRYSYTLVADNSSSLVGPTGTLTDTWKRNLLFRSTDYGVKLAIAELPSDPFYELTLPQTLINYKNVYIDRYIYRTIDSVDNVVAYGNAVLKASDYKGTTTNTTSFAGMAKSMSDQSWSSADVSLQLFNDSGNDYKILFKKTIKP